MITNYFKIAIRNILRQKVYSFINIFGLAVGISICLLVLVWAFNEFSYDKFHVKKDNIFYVYQEIHYANARTEYFTGSFYPLAQLLKNECPEVIEAAKYETRENVLIKFQDKKFVNNRVMLVEPSFLEIFSFPLIKGNLSKALSDPSSIVISEKMSHKYFGNDNPIGKILNYKGKVDLVVTGVIQDIPRNSSLQFDCLIPYVLSFAPKYEFPTHWGGNPLSTVVLLKPQIDVQTLESKISKLIANKINSTDFTISSHLHSLNKLHLSSLSGTSLISTITIISMVSIAILLLACVNFMNLSTAKAMDRTKEVGLRKVIGADRFTLVKQFFSESIVIAFLSLLISILLCIFSLPLWNNLLGKHLEVSDIFHAEVIIGFIIIGFITGIISGSYPAIYLSGFQPIIMLRGIFRSTKSGKRFRGLLVITQFVLSLILLIGALTIQKQLSFVLNKDMGFDKDDISLLEMTPKIFNNYDVIKNELLKNPNIGYVTRSLHPPINVTSTVVLDWVGKNPQKQINFNWDAVDYDYFESLGIKIKEGRSFSQEFPGDMNGGGIIINEEAAKIFGNDQLIGKKITAFGQSGQIVGIVNNYNFRPMQHLVAPIIYFLKPSMTGVLTIKVSNINRISTLHFIENTLKKFEDTYPITLFSFSEAMMEYAYVSEKQLNQIAEYSTVIALFISCLGLLGLATFAIAQRTKELGIRKVLGASAQSILLLLSKEFIKWIIIANVIAWPIAYYLMTYWLQNYAYRIELSWWIFILSGGIALLIALGTVSFQAIKAAIANPIKSLKYE